MLRADFAPAATGVGSAALIPNTTMTPPSTNSPNYTALLHRFYAPPTAAQEPSADSEIPVEDLVELLTEQLIYQQTIPAQEPEFAPLPTSLPAHLTQALKAKGIEQLYSHQAKAYRAISKGQDVTITTTTASGKTYAAYLGILKGCMKHNYRCLAFYNLKALAGDQSEAIADLLSTIPQERRPRFAKLTGDTSTEERKEILATEPHILGVTPEFIHYQLRAAWGSEHWQTFFSQLRYVLVDEAHTCKGVFGANVSLLIQRIKLVVDKYGLADDDGTLPSQRLQFITLSATSGNPRIHARRLTGRLRYKQSPDRLTWIQKSGAATAEKQLLVLRPSHNVNAETAKLVHHLLREGKSGIVFCTSIASVKTLYNLINLESLRQGHGPVGNQIATFYAALKPKQKADVLQQVKTRATRWILSTDALEAGIDIAELDCCIVRGWPGSIQSFRQQIGRCGRRNAGLAIFLPIAGNVLDTYFANHPELLANGPAENISFQVSVILLAKHLMCAAVESGIPSSQIRYYFGKEAILIAQELMQQGHLQKNRAGALWARGFPHREINFRGSLSQTTIQLVNEDGDELEQMTEDIAQREVYPGAIYRSQNADGQMVTYQSLALDLEAKQARLKLIPDTPAFTVATTRSELNAHSSVAAPKFLPLQLLTDEPEVSTSQTELPIPETTHIRHPTGLTLELAWADMRHLITGYDLNVRRYERTCLNRKCLQYKEALPTQRRCPSCNTPVRAADIVQHVSQFMFETPTKVEITTPIVQLTLTESVRNYLQDYVKQLKTQIQSEDSLIPPGYQTLWEFRAEYLALHTAGHQLLKVLPLVVRADTHDANFQITRSQTETFQGIFYNCLPESGAVESLFSRLPELAAKAAEVARTCPCSTGCGNCLIQHGCPDGNMGLFKPLGLSLLDAITRASNE